MTKMIAAKGFTYGTRRLTPDEPFEARTSQDARLLHAIGRARYETADGRAAAPAPPPPKPKPKAEAKKAAAPKKPAAPRRPKA